MLGGIGDMILLLPALQSLRDHSPRKRITLLIGEPNAEEIIKEQQLVDEVILYDRRKRKSLFEIIRFLMNMRKKKFDCAIVASGTHAFKGSLFTRLMGIPYRVGENIDGVGFWYTVKVDYDSGMHELDGALQLVRAIGVAMTAHSPVLTVAKADEVYVNRVLSEHGVQKTHVLIGIHPGSGYKEQRFKRWSKEKFAQLGDEISKRYNAQIILTGGPDEIDLVNDIAHRMQQRPIIAAGRMTIRQTTAIIKQCTLFISNESGLAHIATAVETPVVIIVGATNLKKIGPRGKDITIVRKKLACSPCYDRGHVACEGIDCMESITTEEVVAAVDKVLSVEKLPHVS